MIKLIIGLLRFIIRLILLPIVMVLTVINYMFCFVGGIFCFIAGALGLIFIFGGLLMIFTEPHNYTMAWHAVLLGALFGGIPMFLKDFGSAILYDITDVLSRV